MRANQDAGLSVLGVLSLAVIVWICFLPESSSDSPPSAPGAAKQPVAKATAAEVRRMRAEYHRLLKENAELADAALNASGTHEEKQAAIRRMSESDERLIQHEARMRALGMTDSVLDVPYGK